MFFESVLIANRAEIALRLIRAVQSLGLEAIAVYSEADKNAPHVKAADKSVQLGRGETSDSYLNMEKILDAANRSGAGAIHPGYGFFSENANFAKSCEQAGIVFIGPKAEIIADMGSKIAAKERAIVAGVPVVPGYQGGEQDDDLLIAHAEEIGFPLLVKASAGGGGRGMRVVNEAGELAEQISLARQEAAAAFGDPSLLLEKYVQKARHIEVQVLGDNHGNVIHLLERDCSIQRNHQKLIEEAPAADFPSDVRERMLTSAAELAKSIGYNSAGTVEYIYDPETQDFYFLEMNTRLQVEHPVTEAITGIDLAQWQIRIANGEELSITQEEIKSDGWAIEARVAAENPEEGYLPQTGLVHTYLEPSGIGVRIDSGISEGVAVSHYYDSMLSKVIVHGRNRDDAIAKLSRALSQYRIAGVGTNITFLSSILKSEEFVKSNHYTSFLKDKFEGSWQGVKVSDEVRLIACLGNHLSNTRKNTGSVWGRLEGWRVTKPAGRNPVSYYFVVEEGSAPKRLEITETDSSYCLKMGDEAQSELILISLDASSITVDSDGMNITYPLRHNDGLTTVFEGALSTSVKLLSPEEVLLGIQGDIGSGGNTVQSPMPGLIVEILVKPGDAVKKGDTVIVLEAMKLMQKLTASTDGTISEIYCHEGDTPEKGSLLVTIEPDKPEE
ncbi:acetyl-CoA carboxylase biotin carboxylase subunit [Sneathiella sp. P13V-1]|uniref:acetyl/propionyl/methylcrotonyl-CoA carboxylase subunit alpha n=1 Tax=Sneathiella sp. P13V-1 TaxID=2697366 RepID=UPI00187B3465|nr:acetyl-CoA carboxylase biotin carboxylase subunit [Sneathiella sp. P13V-1]MBE7638424.1 acetyl-CoA carboxylase biotin carboxylase subunit [Sneathiella sp. P13V-1]